MATKQLFALSQGSGRFEACLQEIQEILGPDEVVHQMSLLAATTCEAVGQLLQEEAVEGQPRAIYSGLGLVREERMVRAQSFSTANPGRFADVTAARIWVSVWR